MRWIDDTPQGLRAFEVFAYIAVWVPTIGAAIFWRIAYLNHGVKNEVFQFLLAFCAGIFGLISILGRRKKDTLERRQRKGYEQGTRVVYEQWSGSAEILQGALAKSYRFVEAYKADDPRESGEGAVQQYLDAIALNVRDVFGESCGKLTVSISIPMDDGTALRTAKFQAESPGRHPGKIIPLEHKWSRRSFGAAKIYKEKLKRPVYVPDNQIPSLISKFKDRPYRSFMVMPVWCGHDTTLLGVVSVDSTLVNGFDRQNQSGRRDQLFWMAQPALMGIAISLLDRKTFERYRTYTEQPGEEVS